MLDNRARSAAFCGSAYLLLFIAGFWPALQHFWGVWNTPQGTYGFALLSVPAALYLMWSEVRRGHAASTRLSRWMALVLAVPLAMIWFGAMRVGVEAVHAAVLPLLFWLGALAWTGWAMASRLLLPCMSIAFALPLWDLLQGGLVSLTSLAVSTMVSEVEGLTVLVQGDTIILPSGTLVIESGCSGQRYLLVSMTLAALGSAYYQLRLGRALGLCLLAALMALLGNWLRVFIIVLVAYHTEMRSSLVADHESLGWAVFAVVFMPVFWLLVRWQQADQSRAPLAEPQVSARAAWPAVLLITLLPGLLFSFVPEGRASSRAVELPGPIGEWQPVSVSGLGCSPAAAKGLHALYRGDYGNWAELSVVRYVQPGKGAEILPEAEQIARDMPGLLGSRPVCLGARPEWRATALTRYKVGPYMLENYGLARLAQVFMPLVGWGEIEVLKVNLLCLQCDPGAAQALLQRAALALVAPGGAEHAVVQEHEG